MAQHLGSETRAGMEEVEKNLSVCMCVKLCPLPA